MTLDTAYRYAVYFAPPPGSPWDIAGATWLGRYSHKTEIVDQPRVVGLSAKEFSAITQEPRRYGWHATLKAPFRLQLNSTLEQLRSKIKALASYLTPVDNLLLETARIGNFIALIPAQLDQARQISRIAQTLVTELNDLAQPLSDDDLARHRMKNLTPEQDALMVRWGYPYVMDEFRFHMSLTGDLNKAPPLVLSNILKSSEAHFGGLGKLALDHLALFVEPEKGANFELVELYKIG